MHVPQDVQNSEGLWIKFPVIKIVSLSVTPTQSPVLHLGGGGPVNSLGFWLDADVDWIWDRYRGFAVGSDRDLYIINPRGIGHTNPALSCFEYAEMKMTFKQCDDWNIQPASIFQSQAVMTDIPTLFLHGALDPVLPVEDLEDQMGTFKNSDKVIFDDLSHTVVGVHPCGMEISRAFFDHKMNFMDYVSCDL